MFLILSVLYILFFKIIFMFSFKLRRGRKLYSEKPENISKKNETKNVCCCTLSRLNLPLSDFIYDLHYSGCPIVLSRFMFSATY